jgi:type I restriction-modification system DNA methylase subunit
MLKDGVLTSEERTDIRKIGGIFYTPSIIVHYMVNNTLGKRINELETQYGLQAIDHVKKIKVLDPACGSGSFLIYAYKVLSDFYKLTNEKLNIERLKLLESLNKTDMFKRMEVFKQLPEQLDDIPHHILETQLDYSRKKQGISA